MKYDQTITTPKGLAVHIRNGAASDGSIVLENIRPACPAIPPISGMCSANLWKKWAMSACSLRIAAATEMTAHYLIVVKIVVKPK